MSCAAIGIGGAALIGGGLSAIGGVTSSIIQGNAAGNAAQSQAAAAAQAQQIQQQEFAQQQANASPYQQAGTAALSQLAGVAGQQFTAADFTANPGYQFQLQQGNQAIQQSAAAGGGLQSGGTLKGIAQYTQGLANTTYQQAYENFMQNKTTNYGELAGIAGMGLTANGQVGAAGTNFANNSAAIATGAGNNAAAGQIAQGNALSGGVGAVGGAINSSLGNMGTLSKMTGLGLGPTGGGGGGGGGGGSISAISGYGPGAQVNGSVPAPQSDGLIG